jgi:hypothetical protein
LSSSDDDSNEEKTQISNQKEKIMTTAKMINLDSTDDEVGKCLNIRFNRDDLIGLTESNVVKHNLTGLTELDTDVEASSVIPDASESTIADNEDRADFLAQATSGYIPAPQVVDPRDFYLFNVPFRLTSQLPILIHHRHQSRFRPPIHRAVLTKTLTPSNPPAPLPNRPLSHSMSHLRRQFPKWDQSHLSLR